MSVDVKDFILQAIREGIEEAPKIYMRQLENQLKVDVEIQEAGDATSYLQKLIAESEEKVKDSDSESE